MNETTDMTVVNKETGEIMEQKTPTETLIVARDAARALEELISQNDRPPVMFNGKRHLEFPHWQTLGKFYKCTVATYGAEYIEIAGVAGFKAKADVIDEMTGTKIGSAEAYCMRDERNWKDKPLFQLASMAQTRAGSKALANKFRYVAIVAGYEPTPMEEMSDVQAKPSVQMPKPKPAAVRTPPSDEPPEDHQSAVDAAIEFQAPRSASGAPRITEKQRKLIFAKCQSAKIPEPVLRAHLKSTYGTEHTSDLDYKQLDTLLQWIDRYEAIQ